MPRQAIDDKREECIKELAEWFARHRRYMGVKDIRPIARKYFGTGEELTEFYQYVASAEGRELFKKHLRLKAWELGATDAEYLQFVEVGERVRYIGTKVGKYRRADWPEGAWMEPGVEGVVIEYHPGSPAIRIRGEFIEEIRPWAVVRWDHGGQTAIDPEYEGKDWERIKPRR